MRPYIHICCICRYVGALTGIFSFILFLPCLFKENYGIQEKMLVKDRTEFENTVDHLRSCTNVPDMNFGEAINGSEEIITKSVSSLETASSGFGSADVESPSFADGETSKATFKCKFLTIEIYY